MKQLISFILLASLVLCVAGCGSSADASAENAPAIDKQKDAKVEKNGAEPTPTQD